MIRNNTCINDSFLTFKEKSLKKSIKSIKKRTLSDREKFFLVAQKNFLKI